MSENDNILNSNTLTLTFNFSYVYLISLLNTYLKAKRI